MEWYEKLHLEENPFKYSEETNLVGYEEIVDEIIYRIISGDIMFIEGKPGTGKTALLRKAIEKFGGKGKIIYLNCRKLQQGINIEKVLMNKYGFFRRITGERPHDMILLIDEIQELSRKNCERLKYFFDQNYIRAVIFTGTNYEAVNFTESLRERISKVVKLRGLTEFEAQEMLRIRGVKEEVMPREIMNEVFKLSNNNPKEFLSNCEKLVSNAIESGGKQVTGEQIERILGKKVEATKVEIVQELDEGAKKVEELKKEMQSQVIQIKPKDDIIKIKESPKEIKKEEKPKEKKEIKKAEAKKKKAEKKVKKKVKSKAEKKPVKKIKPSKKADKKQTKKKVKKGKTSRAKPEEAEKYY